MRLHLLPSSLLFLFCIPKAIAPPPPQLLLDETQTRLEQSISALQSNFYNSAIGTYPSSIHWTLAVITTIFASTLPAHVSPPRSLYTLSRLFISEPTLAVKHEAYDDMLWIALEWSEGFRVQSRYPDTPTSKLLGAYVARSKEFWVAGGEGWDEKLCGGGMIWAPKLEPYKNAITNELWISASAGLARLEPEGSPARLEFTKSAAKGWDWLYNSAMTNHQGLFADGFHITKLNANVPDEEKICDARSEAVYTYNQGVILPGLRDLALLTGNDTYLHSAHELAANVVLKESRLSPRGYLTERCDPAGTCSQNAQMFKGIFISALAALCKEATGEWASKCKRYRPFIRRNAESVWKTRDEDGRLGCWWGEPTQGLGEDLWGAEEVVPEAGSFLDVDSVLLEADSQKVLRSDRNDRGRGRTVECMASGIALLAADVLFAAL